MKTCTRCQRTLAAAAFSRDRSRSDGRAHRCRSCDSAKASAWQRENREHDRATKRAWYAVNAEVARVRRQVRESNQKRQAQGIPVQQLTEDERVAAAERRLQLANEPCFYCQKRDERMEVDHFIPISMGGSDRAENLVAACSTCNRRKFTHCGTWAVLRLAS